MLQNLLHQANVSLTRVKLISHQDFLPGIALGNVGREKSFFLSSASTGQAGPVGRTPLYLAGAWSVRGQESIGSCTRERTGRRACAFRMPGREEENNKER